MSKLKRSYTQSTLKKLFALSGNQCAYPECTVPIIGSATDKSDDIVIGEISHIYAVSEKGPRGKPGLTNKELNSPENLILLCPNHHTIVDGVNGEPKDYPAEKLVEWKREHEARTKKHLDDVNSDSFSHFQVLTELVDREIEKEVDILRKSRFFKEFDSDGYSLDLAEKLTKGKLSWGTDSARSRALAWCVRVFPRTEEPDKMEEYLAIAKNLETCDEVKITEAFILSRKKKKNDALKILASIDSPMSRSAAFMIVSHHEGLQGAIDWLSSSSVAPESLDSDGKYYLLAFQLELASWDKARESLDVLSDEDLSQPSPALHYMMATTYLSTAIPKELRATLIKRPPIEEVEFHLASDAEAIRERRKARKHFIRAATLARSLNCSGVAKMCEEYALWLELSDPETLEEGKRRLEKNLRGPKPDIHLVRLAIRFGTNLDPQAVEKEIERQKALNGEITYDASRARLGLVFKKATENLKDAVDYIDRYEDDIACYLDRKSVQVLKIRMLSGTGQLERAEKCLAALKKEGLSETEYEGVRRLILEAKESDQLGVQKRRFEETDSLSDLIILVEKLLIAELWDDACEYGRVLFERTSGLSEAEELARALIGAGRNGQLVEFIRANMSLLEHPDGNNLKIFYCSALYHEGELLEARSVLENLDCDKDDANYRELKLHLAVSLGDKDELYAFVANETLEKDKRNSQDLMRTACIAAQMGVPGIKELTTAAVEKSDEDAEVLATAYFLASESGWENDPEPQRWLEKAVSVSGDQEGPVRRVSFRDALDRLSEWNKQEDETLRQLSRGEIPMFVAAHSLNKSLVDLTLFTAFTNSNSPPTDLRRRGAIPAYSGNRRPMHLDTNGTVAIDATALLTLSFLDLLGKFLDAFNTVYVPHSTLAWLFEEKKKVRFHQPSRIKDAHKILGLIATDKLEKLEPTVVPDRELSDQVGDGLATLIAEAEKAGKTDNAQHAVVRSSPVSRVDSLMEEEADLDAYSDVLRSCQSVIGKLRRDDYITDETADKACAYLKLVGEKPWPDEPGLADGAVLYLDSLSVAYFLRLGILEKLRSAGFRPFVLPRTVPEADAFVSYESASDEIGATLENLQATLNSQIKTGKIKVARQLQIDDPKDLRQLLYRHPSASVLHLAGDCDAIVADDRFINRNAESRIFSTLDVLETLVSSKSITHKAWMNYRTRLRAAGYFFVPVSEDELKHHLEASVQDGKTVENAGLKAIRESFLRVQMSNWLQLPKEWFWAYMSLTVFVRVTRSLWTVDSDFAASRARADWVIDRTNVKNWLQGLCRKNSDLAADEEFEPLLMIMLLSATKTPEEKAENEYRQWLEHRILMPIKEQHPDLYFWIVERYKKKISEYLNELKAKMGNLYDKTSLAKEALDVVPSLLRETLLADPSFRREYELAVDPDIRFESPPVWFKGSEAFRAVRKILSGTSTKEATDAEGRKWKFENTNGEGQLPNIEFSSGDERGSVSSTFISLSPDPETRLRFIEKAASDLGFPSDAKEKWREILKERALEDHEVEKLGGDLLDTPAYAARLIRGQDADQRIPISSLVPRSRRYFERLVGRYDGSETLRDYAGGGGRTLFRELSERQPYDAFLSSLFLSSHSFLTSEMKVDNLNEADFIRACGFLERQGDRISQLGAVEVGLRVLPSMPGIEPCLVRLIRHIRDDDADGKTGGFRLFSALFVLVDGELSSTRLFSSEPPFYRKLAALSQAALINRQMVNSGIDVDRLHKWALDNFGGRHYLQSLVDMRTEPHGSPFIGQANEIRLNCLSRIMIAAEKHARNIKSEELSELVLGAEPGSMRHVLHPFSFYFPGPLDGTGESFQSLPAERSEEIRTQVTTGETSPASFVALANSALIFRLDPDHAELAAKALKSCSYRLADIENSGQLVMMLSGLASVAAVTRSQALADELRIVVRRYRADVRHPVSVGEETMICVAAAASHAGLEEWTEFVGSWMTELAFIDELKDDEASMLRSQLRYLCHAVPDLWVTCDRACAALAAIDKNTSGEQGESLW